MAKRKQELSKLTPLPILPTDVILLASWEEFCTGVGGSASFKEQDQVVQELAISDTAPGMALRSSPSLSPASPTHNAHFLP